MNKNIIKLVFMLLMTIFISIPVLAESNDTTVEIGIKSDYNKVVVESEEGKEYVSGDKLTLKYSEVGNYKYSIYVEDNPTDKYDLEVFVGRKDDNSLYTETVLYKDSNKTLKVGEVEFKKPEKPNDIEIGTGVFNNSLLWGALIAGCFTMIYLLREGKNENE